MAQLATPGLPSWTSLILLSQCMPPHGLTMKSDYLAGEGYTPSRHRAAAPPRRARGGPCTGGIHAQPQVAPRTCLATQGGETGHVLHQGAGMVGCGHGGRDYRSCLPAPAHVCGNEQNNNVPLITESSLYMEEPAAPRVVEVVERRKSRLKTHLKPQQTASGVRFDDEERGPAAATVHEEDADADVTRTRTRTRTPEKKRRGDPNFTP